MRRDNTGLVEPFLVDAETSCYNPVRRCSWAGQNHSVSAGEAFVQVIVTHA